MELHTSRERKGRALNVLGCMYQSDDGIPLNYQKAIKCFREAAELGDKNGQYNLGRIYQRGKEVSRDSRKAVKCVSHGSTAGS